LREQTYCAPCRGNTGNAEGGVNSGIQVHPSLVRESVAAVFALQVPVELPPHHPHTPSVITSILQDDAAGWGNGH